MIYSSALNETHIGIKDYTIAVSGTVTRVIAYTIVV